MVEFDALVDRFGTARSRTEELLKDVLSAVSDGRVPAPAAIDEIRTQTEALRAVYGDLESLALSLDDTAERGDSGLSYVELIRVKIESDLREKYFHALEVLDAFASIVSDEEPFDVALEPYREEARRLFDELSAADDLVLAEEDEPDVDRKDLIVRAVSADGLDSENGAELLYDIAQSYPFKVYQGLLGRKYRLPDSPTGEEPIVSSSDGAKDEPAEEKPVRAEGEEPAGETTAGGEGLEPAEPAGETTAGSEGLEPAEPVGETTAGGEAAEEPPGAEEDEGLKLVQPARRMRQATVAKWKKEFLSSAPPGIRATIPNLVGFKCATGAQLSRLARYLTDGAMQVSQTVRATDFMMRNGFAAQYELPGGERFFYVTEAACKLFSHGGIHSLRKDRGEYWLVNLGKEDFAHSGDISASFARRRLDEVDMFIQFMEAYDVECERQDESLEPAAWGVDGIGNRVFVSFDCEGRRHNCVLARENDALEDDVENVLYVVEDDGPDPVAPDGFAGSVFMVRDGVLSAVRIVEANEDEAVAESVRDGEPAEAEPAGEKTEAKHEQVGATEKNEPSRGEEPVEAEPLQGETPAAERPEAEPTRGEEPVEADSGDPEDQPADAEPGAVTRDETVRPASHPIEDLLDTGSIDTAYTPSDEGFLCLANHMLDNPGELGQAADGFGSVAAALALLEAASGIEGNDASTRMLAKLRLAAGLRQKGLDYTGVTLSRVFGDFDPSDEALILCSYCRALFDPRASYDHPLWSTCEPLLNQYDSTFVTYPELKALFGKLLEIHEVSPTVGFSARVLDMLVDRASRSRKLDEMRKTATRLVEKPVIKTKMTGLPEFIEACFGKDSEMGASMAAIAEDDRSQAELVLASLRGFSTQTNDGFEIDDGKIGDAIDSTWRAAVANKKTKGVRRLEVLARKISVEAFQSRLSLMEEWLSYAEGGTDDRALMRLGELRRELLSLLKETDACLRGEGDERAGLVLVRLLVSSLLARLDGGEEPLTFVDFLRTGRLSLRDDGTPWIEPSHNQIRYFEPWRRVLRHWVDEKPSFEEAAAATLEDDSRTFDNLRQRRLIGTLAGAATLEGPTADESSSARGLAEHDGTNFNEQLEIAYAYGRIDEAQREKLQGKLEGNREAVFEPEDFGLWRELIAALARQVDDLSELQEKRLAARIEHCEQQYPAEANCELLERARAQLFEEHNFDLVEEYLNRFDDGKRTLPEGFVEEDSFERFISDEVFSPLFDACSRGRGQNFARFATVYLREHYPEDWFSRHKTSAESLVKSWPSPAQRKNFDASSMIESFLIGCGMRVKRVRAKDRYAEHYLLELRAERRNQADYQHPIAMFGTKPQNPVDVLVLHGNHSPQEIVNQVSAARVNGMSIVLLDSCLSLQSRRKLAEIFHTSRSKLSPFLVIDQVLALHLALHQQTERLPVLLKCTLPFTYYQPFVRDGGATADEMFFGREAELRTIVSPQGATIVYGGRQLGKTALLERAESLQHIPDEGRIAVYVSVQECASERAFVEKIVADVNRKVALGLSPCDTIAGLRDGIRDAMARDGINAFLLLIDEADSFLDSISADSYKPLMPLADLRRESGNAFKFVLAGLHNVVRYKNAIANNGTFGQLGTSVCVNPLKPADALRLMSRPLSYLGFKVDRYPHIETILTNTNYYPGIIQFFGYELVDTMTKQYGSYYQAARGNPPYELSKEQLGTIMNSRNLNRSIKDKYLMSLALDPRYLALARCIALLTYDTEGDGGAEAAGFAVSDILAYARDMSAAALAGETSASTTLLLDEMVDMGILAKTESGEDAYRLRMHRFLSIVGTEESILTAFAEELD